jgi:transcriptional regulator with XRE-family HTH domain
MAAQDIYEELGKRIRQYRKGIGRTQEQLAAQVGISRASLANIEAGRQQVLVHHLHAIALALGIDSVAMLLPISTPKELSKKSRFSSLPLPETGLTEKQRQDILQLLDIKPTKKLAHLEKGS